VPANVPQPACRNRIKLTNLPPVTIKIKRFGFLPERSIFALHNFGGLAQLARALAWHARGHRFDSDILHIDNQGFTNIREVFFISDKTVIKHKLDKIGIKYQF
jgi:hypothetical protein